MKLKTVTLQNYRCYQDNDFTFGADCTIIIGKNGTGKSSLLSAIRKGMTFIFSNTGGNKLIKNNTNKVEGLSDWDTTFLENGEGFQWPTDIKYQIYFDSIDLIWNFHKDKYNGKLHPKYYKDAQKTFEKYHLTMSKTLPLLGFYGDCYPHKKNSRNAVVNNFNKVITSSKKIPRDAGYFLWNSDGSLVPSWFHRTKFILSEIQHRQETILNLTKDIELLKSGGFHFHHMDETLLKNQFNILNTRLTLLKHSDDSETNNYEEEFNFVKDKLITFFSKMNEFDSDEMILFDIKKRRTGKNEHLFFSFGNEHSFSEGVYNEESLPMGYQRLIHIAYDIAYRYYILNGKSETFSGLVLIDELELHLHPSLQQTVLDRFRKTFPGLQFIITTHSPIIISNFFVNKETTKIIQLEKLDGEYTDEELPNYYSMDYNSNLVDVMGVNVANKELDALVSAYNFLKNEDKNAIAKKYYEKITDFFDGNIPKFIIEKMTL